MSDDAQRLKELAARAVNGDGRALSTLCEQLTAPVHRLCLRMLGDPRDAEDAAQDVMVKVVTHLARFEGRSALMTWVHQIAVRHVLALKKSRAEERPLDEATFAALLEQGLAYAATQNVPTPEDRALLSEVRLSCTQGMLMMLSREERLALVLVDLLGFDAAEAAGLVEVSHDALRQRLSRARTRLGTFLEARCGVANPEAKCRCEKQLPAKKSLGLTPERQRYAPLAIGDLPLKEDVSLATAELKSLRTVASAFHREGLWRSPDTLRHRVQQLLPTLLGP